MGMDGFGMDGRTEGHYTVTYTLLAKERRNTRKGREDSGLWT